MSANQPSNNARPDWRELRQQEREERRADKDNNAPWIVGAVLIVVGIVLLLQNFGFTALTNWWALFILIPGVGSFGTAWAIYRNQGGQFTTAMLGPILIGLILIGVSFAFLFEVTVNWNLLFPIILILVGIGALLGSMGFRRS